MRFIKGVTALAFLLFTYNFSYTQPIHQKENFTHADTLRGSNGPGRDWWNALKYDLYVTFNPADSTISGYNIIDFKVLKKGNTIQIDLQEPLIIDSIKVIAERNAAKAGNIPYTKAGNAYFVEPITWMKNQELQDKNYIFVYYHGKPKVAKMPPWDGGVIWKKDKYKNPFISIACQGLGASVWYPCKDIQSDEPDSAEMHITIPDSLTCIGNGRLRGKATNGDGTVTYNWAVTVPINNYNIIPYIGKYSHFSEIYKGENGELTMDYWVLDSNINKAKEHFKDAPLMMKAFEYWFGPFPFYEDGFKLVEAPHLGMEHQSAIAYGNQYKKGYLGRDMSGSGWGLKWDYIIVHESGHEWFANNITTKDIADMWVHEGFTTYSEVLFTEYYFGKNAGTEYAIGLRKGIQNMSPVIGPYGVNQEGHGDMYPKGANLIHTIRQVINNDSLFREILRSLNKRYRHQTTSSKEVEDYICKQSKIDFSKVFDQYLRQVSIPVLEYKVDGFAVQYRYTDCIDGFKLPVKVKFGEGDNQTKWLTPTTSWKTIHLGDWYNKETFTPGPNFYIKTKYVE